LRYRFGPALEHALRVRGLSLVRVAEMANVAPSTVSAALRGRQLNVRAAFRIARIVSECEVIPELEEWSADILSNERDKPGGHAT
jgi:predicted transcriptional regulator